jgi:hypothetical protein
VRSFCSKTSSFTNAPCRYTPNIGVETFYWRYAVKQKKPLDESQRLAWHPAFVNAIRQELKEYGDALEILPEYQLTSEPLRIDCVIIKKVKM